MVEVYQRGQEQEKVRGNVVMLGMRKNEGIQERASRIHENWNASLEGIPIPLNQLR